MTTWDSLCLTEHNSSWICSGVLVYFDSRLFSSVVGCFLPARCQSTQDHKEHMYIRYREPQKKPTASQGCFDCLVCFLPQKGNFYRGNSKAFKGNSYRGNSKAFTGNSYNFAEGNGWAACILNECKQIHISLIAKCK